MREARAMRLGPSGKGRYIYDRATQEGAAMRGLVRRHSADTERFRGHSGRPRRLHVYYRVFCATVLSTKERERERERKGEGSVSV